MARQFVFLLIKLFIMFVILRVSNSMFIPEDIEILDGYTIEDSSDYYPQDTGYYEAKSLSDVEFVKAIRNKRSPIYHILESPGLRSHFHLENNEINHFVSVQDRGSNREQSLNDGENFNNGVTDATDFSDRHKRSENEEEKNSITDNSSIVGDNGKEDEEEEIPSNLPELPKPEKQVMDAEFYNVHHYRNKNPFTSGNALNGNSNNNNNNYNWNPIPFHNDYSKVGFDDEEPLPDATVNEGIKGRTPRVNFITQSKKLGDDIGKDRMPPLGVAPLLPKVSTFNRNRFEKLEAPTPEIFPSRSYDPYLRRYDRYDDQYYRYDPYFEDYYIYRRRYDPYDSYSPRTPSYPEAYYDYPDRRFDIPEPRDYPVRPTYSSNFDPTYVDRYPYLNNPRGGYTGTGRQNRRIIYYAHLPEIVRTPPPATVSDYNSYNKYGTPSTTNFGGPMAAGATNNYESNSYHGPASSAYRSEMHNNPSLNRATGSSGASGSIGDPNYGFMKREKKDNRMFPSNSKVTVKE